MPTPESTPTVAIARPRPALSSALAGLVPAKLVISAIPSRATRNSSGAPNSRASRLNGATTTNPMTPMSPPTNEASGGDDQRRSAAALLGHLVAVEGGGDRGRLARDAQQHRGGGAAVGRAVQDGGEHDDGGGGVQAEGDRDQK